MSEDRLHWTLNGTTDQTEAVAGIRALTGNDINMVFQPIVELDTGLLFAHEALVRCKLPQYASPLMLFVAAEKERACGHLGHIIRQQTFERCPHTALFVNVHPEELAQRWLVRPDDPMFFHEREVYLEITESAAFTHYDLCMSVLKDVCARAGVHLVVDDYGAGHSNLARILDLNPEIVKLDGALIRGIDKDRRRQLMVRHMVALCADLGAKVVAECIETIDELKAVADQGVHFGQGYVLARPAFPPPEFNFPLHGRMLPSPAPKNRPPPKPMARLSIQDATTAAAPGSTRQPSVPRPKVVVPGAPPVAGAAPVVSAAPAESAAARPSKGHSKPPGRRPTPPALPKRPPPLPGTR